jgi:DNA-binding response OmpR family regulator
MGMCIRLPIYIGCDAIDLMEKILVIDDDKPFRKMVSTMLRRQGYEVLGADNGAEGVALALVQQPNLILCDVNMAGKNGFEVLKELRALPKTSTIPVIIMTGEPQKATASFSMDQGADDNMQKPFAMEVLLASVSVRLQRQTGIKQAVEAKNQEVRFSAAEKLNSFGYAFSGTQA